MKQRAFCSRLAGLCRPQGFYLYNPRVHDVERGLGIRDTSLAEQIAPSNMPFCCGWLASSGLILPVIRVTRGYSLSMRFAWVGGIRYGNMNQKDQNASGRSPISVLGVQKCVVFVPSFITPCLQGGEG